MRRIGIRGNLFLLVITVVSVGFGIFCRLDGLGRESLWIDEIYTARRVANPSLRGLLSELLGTPFPPLYYVVLWIWVRLWGNGDAVLRGLAATCGLLAIPATYGVWSGLIGRRAALWAVSLLATNAFHAWYSRDAKMYSAVWLLATIACGAFLHAIRSGRNHLRWLLVLGVADGCLCLVSYVGVVPLGVQVVTGLYLFATRRELRGVLTDMVATTAIALVPAILWFSEAIRAGTERVGIGWIPRIAVSRLLPEFVDHASIVLLGFRSTEGTGGGLSREWLLLASAVPWITLAVGTLLAMSLKGGASPPGGGIEGLETGSGQTLACLNIPRWLALWGLIPVVGSLAFSSLVFPLWSVPRYLAGASPALLLWAGVAIDRSGRRRIAVAAGLLLIGVNVSLIVFARTHRANPPWDRVAACIAAISARNSAKSGESKPIADSLIVCLQPYDPLDGFCLDFELNRVNGEGASPDIAMISPSEANGRSGTFLAVWHGWEDRPSSLDPLGLESFVPDPSHCRRLFRGEIFADPYKMIPSPITRRILEIWECGRPDGEGAANAR